MKKCSTQVFARALALAGAGIGALPVGSVAVGSVAMASVPVGSIAVAFVAAVAALVAPCAQAQTATAPLELSADAPDKYVVVRGDTLWGISGRFLQKPWRWPEIWQLNREQIANPHLIYPGDIVYLDTAGGQPRLRLGRAVGDAGAEGGTGTGSGTGAQGERRETLQPRVRAEPAGRTAVPTLNLAAIEAFLNRPLIVDEKGLREHPRLIGTQEGRVYLGRGDLAYARGFAPEVGSEWHVYRTAQPLRNPDTRQTIAWEALYVGSARVERAGDPVTLRITGTSEEIGVGDRLMPAERVKDIHYAPRAPSVGIDGRVVSVYRGVDQAGRNNVVSVSAGSMQGVEVGHVLRILQRGRAVADRETPSGKVEMVKLPDEPVGSLLVFRVFDNIAYGLIMDANRSVAVGDAVATP